MPRDFRAHDLAQATRYTREWIWRLTKLKKIPGARWTGKQFRYRNGAKLRAWIASKAARTLRKRPDKSSSGWGQGFATIQGISTQWKRLMYQIGDFWMEWTPDEIDEFADHIAPIVEFDRKLRGKRKDFT